MAGQLLPWIDSGDAEGNRNSMQNFLGDGVTTSFDFNFAGGYIDVSHVKAYLYNFESGITTAIEPVVLTGPNTIQVIPAPTLVDVGQTTGQALVVYRDTPKDQPLIDYSTGSVLDELNLDTSNKQSVFGTAEMADRFDAINASSADAITRSFVALTTAQAADAKSDTAIADSAAAVITANAAEVTAANALQIAEDAVAAATGFNVDIDMYTGNDTTARDIQWSTGSVASPGNKRWELGTDTASDFALRRYDDAGALLGTPWAVDRQTGLLVFDGQRLTNVGTPTAATDAATKGYADTKINPAGTVDFTAHQKLFNSTPTDPLHAASKGYVDAQDLLYASREPDLILNPHGSIQQETTAPQTAAFAYFADQWIGAYTAPGAAAQYGVATGTVSAHDPSHMFFKTTTAKGTLAAGDFSFIEAPIEGINARRLLYGDSLARGSWLRWRASSSQAGTASVAIRNGPDNRSFVQAFAVTTTPTDYFLFVPGDTTGTWPTGNSLGAVVSFCHACGTTKQTSTLGAWQTGSFIAANTQSNMLDTVNRELRVTDVSWKSSQVLLPFTPIDWETELLRCQRYFWSRTSVNVGESLGVGQCYASNFAVCMFPLPVTMRGTPTLDIGGDPTTLGVLSAAGANIAASGIVSTAASSPNIMSINLQVSGGLVGGNGTILLFPSAGKTVRANVRM